MNRQLISGKRSAGIDRAARLLERTLGQVMFRKAPLRTLVAEVRPDWAGIALSNWSGGLAKDEANRPLGILSRNLVPLPAVDNAVKLAVEPDGHIRLTIPLTRSIGDSPPTAELALYVNADGEGGPSALDALRMLASAVWPADVVGSTPTVPYPQRGLGPLWTDADEMTDWVRLIRFPYAERFLRFPLHRLAIGRGGEIVLRAWAGRTAAQSIRRNLQGRLFVNHFLLGNRVIERIEPDHRDSAAEDPLALEGVSPVLLELQDVDTEIRYYDHRYAPQDLDPARLVRLDRQSDGESRVTFLRHPIGRRRLRAVYLRSLDWGGLRVRPGLTELDVNRETCLVVQTEVYPYPTSEPESAEIRRGLVSILRKPRRPRYPSLAEVTRIMFRCIPPAIRRWIDETPSETRPFGCAVDLRVMPGAEDGYAYPTWVFGLVPRSQAPRAELARLFPDLSQRLAHHLGGGFGVILEWVESEVHDG